MITEDFIEYLKKVKKMSPNTVEAYKRDIDAFSRFLGVLQIFAEHEEDI